MIQLASRNVFWDTPTGRTRLALHVYATFVPSPGRVPSRRRDDTTVSVPAPAGDSRLVALWDAALALALGVCVGRPQSARTVGRVSTLVDELRRRGVFDELLARSNPTWRARSACWIGRAALGADRTALTMPVAQ
ncbi:DUF7423 domain-containing protein [Mycolicibacterium lacusdiani]|uniref:DUF7423 domain-containing protein n=1 Tax=Mycolicibacterium lacusdiani TaxID=2895283 RepID=UPI003FD8667C